MIRLSLVQEQNSNLLNQFHCNFGHFSGRGYYSESTNGYELRAKGLFKLCALWAKDPITDFLRDHIDISLL